MLSCCLYFLFYGCNNMFSGIVESVGRIVSMEKHNKKDKLVGVNMIIRAFFDKNNGIMIGDSISCSGVCLTVTKIENDLLYFYASIETINATSISNWKIDNIINLERSLMVGDRIGGHFVYGHVDCTGVVVYIEKIDEGCVFKISIPQNIMPYIAIKGSLAIDGVAFTINEIQDNIVSFFAIPHTIKATSFNFYQVNTIVNIEVDPLARYIIRYITQ